MAPCHLLLLFALLVGQEECSAGTSGECAAATPAFQSDSLLQKLRSVKKALEVGDQEDQGKVDHGGDHQDFTAELSCDLQAQRSWATAGQDVDVLGFVQGGPGEPVNTRSANLVEVLHATVLEDEEGDEDEDFGVLARTDELREGVVNSQEKEEEKAEVQDVLKHHPRRKREQPKLVEIRRAHQMPHSGAATFNAVSPVAGSTAGGTTVTVWGSNLYLPHAQMDAGGGASPSSLQPSVRVFLGTIECVVESFQSRPDAVKCVTPALDDGHMHFTDVALPVSVMKLQANGTYAPASVQGSTPVFTFSSAATPELVSVMPQVSGPGDVLRIHAWSCSGVVEAEPIELVRLGSTDSAVSQGSGHDGAVNTLVDDPAEAWGAVCAPFPPHGVRNELQQATQIAADQAFANVEGGPESTGAKGLYGLFFKDPDPNSLSASITSPEGMDEFLANSNTAHAYRYFIAPVPNLAWDQWWENTRASYVVVLEGWLFIEHPGNYRFRIRCEDSCLTQVGERRLVDKHRPDRRTGSWRSYITTDFFYYTMGWQRMKIIHVNILNPGGSSAMSIEYEGPPTNGFEVIPQRYLRAGITQATVDSLNRDADRQAVGRSPQSLAPAKRVQEGGKANGAKCPGSNEPMLVEFSCKVPEDMQPGFYNLKFHDYHYGQSVEGPSAQWGAGMGARKASVRITPKITKVEELPGGDLFVTGMGLDELEVMSSGGRAHYGDLEYEAINGSQDYIELTPAGPVSNQSAARGGSTQTMGSRGLLRQFWFRNMWPGQLEALGQMPSMSRTAELETPIEDANGAAAGFAERLTGVLVPPMTGECRFRVQGTQRHSRDTENDARLYLAESLSAPKGNSRPVPVMFWPGKNFSGGKAEVVDLTHLGYQGYFGGEWSMAVRVTFASTSGVLFAFGQVEGNRISVYYSEPRLTFQVCRGTRCYTTSTDNKMDQGTEHKWIFSVTSLGVMVISRDNNMVARQMHGIAVESQSRPYLHLWMGRGVHTPQPFVGSITDVKIFDAAIDWGDAFSPEAQAPPAVPVPPALKVPYYELGQVLGQPLNVSNSSSGAPLTHLSTLAENNFNNLGDRNPDRVAGKSFSYTLSNGYPCVLQGWTYTRTWAKGFLTNSATASAEVSWLQPGANYTYKVYQYAQYYQGTNYLSVNGGPTINVHQRNSDAPTAEGTAVANADGKIIFEFSKNTRMHFVHLSGIALAGPPPVGEPGLPVHPVDLGEEGLGALGGAMSIAFTARWDIPLFPESRIIDFASGASDRIVIKKGSGGELVFCVETQCLSAAGVITPNKESRFLVSVNRFGEMFIYCESILVAESRAALAAVPATVQRLRLWVGKASSGADFIHVGQIKALKIFKGEALWKDAFGAGALSAPPLPPLPPAMPDLVFAGRTYSGNTSDFDIASDLFPSSIQGGVSVAFTARFDTAPANAQLVSMGSADSKLDIGTNASGGVKMDLTAPSSARRRRRHPAPVFASMNVGLPALGEENDYLCSVTSGGHMVVYKDGALLEELPTAVLPYVFRPPLRIARGFTGLLKDIKIYKGFVRWVQVYPAPPSSGNTTGNGTALLQAGRSWQTSWEQFEVEKATQVSNSRVRQSYGSVGTVTFSYGNPIVSTDLDRERVSAWMMLRQGEEYPFKLERKLGGKTAETGVTGWKRLGFECKSLAGHPELLPRRSEMVTMQFKDFPVRVTLPNSTSGYQLSFRGRTTSIVTENDVEPAFKGLFTAQCDVQPPVDGTTVKLLNGWEGANPTAEAYCGWGVLKPDVRTNGIWELERVKAFEGSYMLRDFPYLSMCFKLQPGAAVNMLVKAKVGSRNREQWFSIGLTLPNFHSFYHDLRRAAQFPVDANATQDQWQCPSISLMDQVMAFQDYERRFRDVNYHNFNPAHLSNMEIKGIYFGTPVQVGGAWQKLQGQITVDQLVASATQVSITQTSPAATGPSLGFSSMRKTSPGLGWSLRWFNTRSVYQDRFTTTAPVLETISEELYFSLSRGPPGLPTMWDDFSVIATANIFFEDGRYRFSVAHDDEATIYVDGVQVYTGRCCVRIGSSRWSNPFATTAGLHTVEVHMREGGGHAGLDVAWRKEGDSTVLRRSHAPVGVGTNTFDVIPPTRASLLPLKAMLEEISISSALQPNVTLPEGVPQEVVTARLLPPRGTFVPAYVVTGTGLDTSLDVNRTAFNRMFAKCPIVRYQRNGMTHSIYVRSSVIPSGFDAYSVFLHLWSDQNNVLGQDFNIYSSEDDARSQRNGWTYCNYGSKGVGYPRECGPNHRWGNQWFSVPSAGGASQITTGAGFAIYDGQDCFAPAVTANSTMTPPEVTFPMDSNSTSVIQILSDAGFPSVDYRVLGLGGVRWLDLSSQPVTIPASDRGRTANLAVDGHFSQDHHLCTTTPSLVNPWITVQLGGTFEVEAVRLLARRHDGSRYLSQVTVSVDGIPCARHVNVADGGSEEVPCRGGYGSSITIQRETNGHLIVCEIEVGVRDTSIAAGGEESGYSAMLTGTMPGDTGERIVMSSPMATDVQTHVLSSGARYWSQVTDYWFRIPYKTKQVTFGPWRDYICATELSTGCAPVAATSPSPSPAGASLLHASGQRHPSLLARPPHTLDGGDAAAMLGRRHPQRRWRHPQRFHTPESLESMRRAVFGTAVRPRGWAEASLLLQEHTGRQKHFANRHSGTSGADPRSDPNAMPWSSPSSWGGEQPPNFDTADIVYIPEGKTALLDMDVYIRFWVIEGNVVWDQTKDLHMQAEAIVVNGGELLIGSEQNPYTMSGQITLHGHWHSFKLPLFGTKGIFQPRGNIEMHGVPTAVTWTELEHTAHPGDTNITLRKLVDWQPGDHIIIAASDKVLTECRLDRRDYCQVEERFVKAVDGKVVTLARPLVYRHVAEELDPLFGPDVCSEDPVYCQKTQVRSEVGLLTRNIKVKGSNFVDGSGPAGSEGYGAHIMMAERGKFSYVEFHWMGQAFQMGRYPIHYHLTGLNPTSYLKGCSLHTTFQRGVTIHGTHQATVKDNVLYNHLAHGYFIEDGNEHDNIFENNLGMMGHVSLSMLNSDQTPATFWIRNPSNYFRNNHAAGCASFGFWFDTLEQAAHTLQRQFLNNTAHSNGDTGVWIDIVDPRESCVAPDAWTVDVPFRDSDAISQPVHNNAPQCSRSPRVNSPLMSTTTWGNGESGITLFETGHLHVLNHRSVSEPIGTRVWGVQSDNWPDETNNWYGPIIKNSAYHTQSELTSAGFVGDCSIKTPWDDTLFITGAQFIGPVTSGHLCPCTECMIVNEGGYQTRTSKLTWHNSAGTPSSPKAFWSWQFQGYYFDLDGSLTEDVPECQQYGCYLHSPIFKGGTYSQRTDANATSFLAARTSEKSARARSSCLNDLVGGEASQVIPDAQITYSSIYRNEARYQRVRLDGNMWSPASHDANQWIQFDFGTPKFVTAIQTKGRSDSDNWVRTYRVSYSMDGIEWKQLERIFPGNRDRNTLMENRVTPFLATMVRIEPKTWHRWLAMRASVLGCDGGSTNFTSLCYDRAYLDDSYRNCRAIERSYNYDKAAMQEFCTTKGHFAKNTVLTANQACCACGGGTIHYNLGNSSVTPPDQAPVLYMPGGTGYLEPNLCREVDSTGGIVCSRGSRMQTITVKDAGIWHTLTPIDIQSDYGWAESVYNPCYKQYEFTVLQDMRHALMPPLTPTKMHDWDKMSAHITMRKGDKYVLQVETIHNPDGFTVEMPGVTKTATCDQAPVPYGPDFFSNQTLLDRLSRETSHLSAARLGLSLAYDMYKVAHMPLLESASQDSSAANWAYLAANESTVATEWYPGMFSFLLSDKGVVSGANHYGPWNGVRHDPMEKLVTRPLATTGGAEFGFSHIHTTFSWARWDRANIPPGRSADIDGMSRLEYLVRVCGMSPTAFQHYGPEVSLALANHSATNLSNPNPIAVGRILRFNWSAWPIHAGVKPTGPDANVTIHAHWEVILDENVTNLNLLDIRGVLKFADQPGCCVLSARYIMVGAFWGRLEAGTEAVPFTNGKAHIILSGQPMTPPLSTLQPHIRGSAKWMKSKFLAVQGTLSLFGAPRASIWSKIAVSANIGDTSITLEGGDFQVGDRITIDRGLEKRTLTGVTQHGSQTVVSFADPLRSSYKGADHVHLGKIETTGLMASYVGLLEGHTVVIEGEDTPGPPMCSINETHTCAYEAGFPRGVGLHDFAKQVVAQGAAPNCRPCGACSEMDFSGYLIAMAHFHMLYDRCPKDHGSVQASNVDFIHSSSIHLYHDYSAGNYPYDVPKDFSGAWSRRPYSWWEDPVWAELHLPNLAATPHVIKKCSFNNEMCGTALALATSGVYTVPTESVEGNVFLEAGVGLNAVSRNLRTMGLFVEDFAGPFDDNVATRTMGVGSPNDDANPAKTEKFKNPSTPKWSFVGNFLSGAPFASLAGSEVKQNVFLGPVRLQGTEMDGGAAPAFYDNTISSPNWAYCIAMWTQGTHGISDNVVHSCRTCVGFRAANVFSQGVVSRMKLLNCGVGIDYASRGPDSKKHDATQTSFRVEDTYFYAKEDGSGTGIIQPTVHSTLLGEPAAPDWWNKMPKFFPIGHSSVSLYFHSEMRRCHFVGFDHRKNAVVIKQSKWAVDGDYYPMTVAATTFEDTSPEAYVQFGTTRGVGTDIKQCLQIDCDGRRNFVVVDVDGSLLGQPGTIIPTPQKFYDKLSYADPMGFSTMEDLIPMPQRYDRFGDAIPFPAGVDHGTGGGLEYDCKKSSMQEDGRTPGCDVLFMEEGGWVTRPDVPGFAPGTHIVAIREDGGMVHLDPLHHGYIYANSYVRTSDCTLTMHPDDSLKPESQHARRYGRVAPGQFGTHPNASKIQATKGPVYSVPGIYRDGCTEIPEWKAFSCPGGQHRHLLIEVMDWNFIDRRVAPVSVEVNDQFAPQGGALNVLTGPAMWWPEKRVQIFHALGHLGLRHNIYFSANPPNHLRIHLQNAPPDSGVIVCIYYGLPNTIYAYVNGQRKEPLAGAVPTWDNLVLTRLTPDMPHGTHFYDRIGVETGRPGYLYAVVRGGEAVDFKISHKVQLTTKITVSSTWGGWNNAGGDDFFNKGIDGLVRNIALLIGAPPNRVKILGEGSAVKGTFWNEDTTSKDFAEWMWKQNKSMAYADMDDWLSAPNSRGVVNATPAQRSGAFLQKHHRQRKHAALLQSVETSRRHLVAAALETSGEAWVGALKRLSEEERQAVFALRALLQLTDSAETQQNNLINLQQTTAEREALGVPCNDTQNQSCDLPVTIAVDDEDYTPASAQSVQADVMKDAVAVADNENNQAEIQIEDDADSMFLTCSDPNSSVQCTDTSNTSSNATNGSYPILNVKVDDVPHMLAPMGWQCDAELFQDGSVCHCDCGIWDPDCDLGSVRVAATSVAEGLNLLDTTQVAVLMNLVDADGDANGVLNGNEIVGLDVRLGQSALLGLAQRIVEAQEKGANQQSANPGAMRLGDFAMLEATETSDCAKLLTDGPPVGSELASFSPMCVRDNEFYTLVGQATGRCSLLPQMKVGSQCMVPGNLGVTAAAVSHNNNFTDTNDTYVPSPEAVCGILGRIFRSGQGVGGHRSAGVGVSSAKWTHPGGEFMPGTDKDVLDMNTAGFQTLDSSLQGGLSFFATVRYDKWENDVPVFAFGFPRGSSYDSLRKKHITLYSKRNSVTDRLDLEFHMGYGGSNWRHYFRVQEALRVGEEARLLVSLSADGKVMIYKNSALLVEQDFRTNQMVVGPFDNMWIAGGAHGKCLWRHCSDARGFEGLISDIRIWDSVVTWNEAVAGVPPGSQPQDTGEDPSGDLPAACIASRKNTWDFLCSDTLPPELVDDFGYTGAVDPQAQERFNYRQVQGEVTVCDQSIRVKTAIFHGKFGDGLTGEYFSMRRDCNPPFLFGRVPKLVKVDQTIWFEHTLGFRAPFNEYAVRWTGKILIESPGTYRFKLASKDGSWLAIGGRLVVDNGHCHSPREHEGTVDLDKGGLNIAILFFNRGPQGRPTGTLKLSYMGPDTGDNWAQVPQDRLASAPLRLSRMGGSDNDTSNTSNQTEAVRMGSFVYDEDTRLGIMPAGSCDISCRQGNLKAAAAPFKFFCSQPTTVSFVASVNQEAREALLWLDSSPVNVWNLFPGASLVEARSLTDDETAEASLFQQQSLAAVNETASLLLSMRQNTPDSFVIIPSAPSPDFAVTGGEHTLLFQGRAGDDEAFAFGGLRLDKGVENCVFFLEGSDKLPDDC